MPVGHAKLRPVPMPEQSNVQHLANQYRENGFLSGIRVISPKDAQSHRDRLESAEAVIGNLHYQSNIHTVLRSPWELATQTAVLDLVEAMIGPDILLHNATYIIKEPRTRQHVSWHQDLTYWGFDDAAQVSMWLALSVADETSGCMQMVPGSHLIGEQPHEPTDDADNVLLQGQTIRDVDTANAVLCSLAPGEASFHHGWTLHASMPNPSADRRIGLNVQYIAPHMKQLKTDDDTAILVRGVDRYQHFKQVKPARAELDEAALARHRELQALYVATAGSQ